MATSTPPSELWDIDQLAEYLGTGRRFIYRLTHERRIRFHRVGKQLRFDPADVAAYLDSEAVDVSGRDIAPPKRRPGRPRATARPAR